MLSQNRYNTLELPAGAVITLAAEAAQAEAAGQLTQRQLSVIHEHGWFRMFIPRAQGGLQLPLPEALAVEEALAAIDGSLGWTVTLCSGAGLFAGFVAPELKQSMFSGPEVCIGGSGMPSGTAEHVGGGYRVRGSWHYATGAPHLSAFSTNCVITANGIPIADAEENPEIRSFLFYPGEVSMFPDWKVMGLKATASHSFSIDDIVVPAERSFLLRPESATGDDPVYRYPFLQFAELTLAANFGGMGLGFLDAFRSGLSRHGGNELRQGLRLDALAESEAKLDVLRQDFHQVAARSWELLCTGGALPDSELEAISNVSRAMASGVRRIAADLFPFAGLAAAGEREPINRIWRDLFTATQHALLTYPA